MWKRLRAIERLKPGGYLLDVGCGTGIFLAEAIRRRRWEVIGVEPNEYAATYARQRLGINIFIERFTKVHLPAGAFDIITMWNVLEHFDKPIANLRYAYHLLHDGGWLVLSIPNLESLDARLFGAYWVGWDLPRHLYLFPRRVLRNILTQIGFTVQGMRCISTSYAALGHSLDFWSQKWANKCPSLIKALLRIYRTLPVRAALILPLRFLDQINFSSIITIFAQKGVPKRS
jgi:SAM-dependent methyltransferase